MLKKTSKSERIPFTPIELSEVRVGLDSISSRYMAGTKTVCGTTDLNDRTIYLPHVFLGIRSLLVQNDGVELFYYCEGHRHSLAVVEFQSNGGYKVIIHTVNKTILPRTVYAALPELYNAAFIHALFPEYHVYIEADTLCMRTPSTWVPMHIDSKVNSKHYALIKIIDLVDSTTVNPLMGPAPNRHDRWHTRFIDVVADPEQVSLISPLSATIAGIVARNSVEGNFDPDTEVKDIPGDQL